MARHLQRNKDWIDARLTTLTELTDLPRETLDRFPTQISGGQRQRLAIARMILTNPAIVILDEATSALDAETEFQLYAALDEFLNNRTTLIVAHRLSAIKKANRVYVFESGNICEQGSHQELLSQNGLYAKLYGVRQSMG